LIRSFATFGSRPGQLSDPRKLAIDSKGNVWVTDSHRSFFDPPYYSRIEVFSEKGNFEGQFSSDGSGRGQVSLPFGLALDPRGNVWVTDNVNSRVERWTAPSQWPPTYSSSFGSYGSGETQLKSVTGVAVEPTNGNLVTA